MKAIIFVYTNTRVNISGTQPVRRFDPGGGVTFDRASIAADAGSDSVLNTGIYLSYSDSEKEPPPINAVTGKAGTDYDMVVMSGKDQWPDPNLTEVQRSRIKTAFPGLLDEELNAFIYEDFRSS